MSNFQKCTKCGAIACSRSKYDNGFYCFPSHGGCGESFPAKIERTNGYLSFAIPPNRFLHTSVDAFSHDYYVSPNKGGGQFTNMILAIKNSFNRQRPYEIDAAKNAISEIVKNDLDDIVSNNQKFISTRPIVITVPRSKPDSYWQQSQLQFKPAISAALGKSIWNVEGSSEKWLLDGTNYIVRTVETKTTHQRRLDMPENTGMDPFPGITQNTCSLNGDVSNKQIILIDDIYTEGVGIDEDCVQFLLNKGAASVTLYTLGKTK